MTKNEFLDSLREYLSYELPDRLVKHHMQYYTEYFKEQAGKGKNAQTVCDELGDPQLIARTIIDSEKAGADGIPNSGDEPDFHEEMYGNAESAPSSEEYGNGQYGNAESQKRSGGSEKQNPFPGGGSFHLMGHSFGCLPILLIVLIIGGLLSFAFTLLGSIFRGGPFMTVLLFLLLGWTLYRYYNGKRK